MFKCDLPLSSPSILIAPIQNQKKTLSTLCLFAAGTPLYARAVLVHGLLRDLSFEAEQDVPATLS